MNSQQSKINSKRITPPAFIFATILSVCLLSSSLSLQAASPIRTLDAVVAKVVDGDTVHAQTQNGTKLKVRLYGIDAPELARAGQPGQPFAKASRKHLSNMVLGKTVRLDIWGNDRYRRLVAIIWRDKRNVNQEMIEAGMAEAYSEYLKTGALQEQVSES